MEERLAGSLDELATSADNGIPEIGMPASASAVHNSAPEPEPSTNFDALPIVNAQSLQEGFNLGEPMTLVGSGVALLFAMLILVYIKQSFSNIVRFGASGSDSKTYM